jgi:hypothetical protein
MRFPLFISLLILTTPNVITADPRPQDFIEGELMEWDSSSFILNSDENFFISENSSPLDVDLMETSFTADEISNSDSESWSILDWNDNALIAADPYSVESSCRTENNFWADDEMLADNSFLQARDNAAPFCPARPEEDKAIDSLLEFDNLLEKFRLPTTDEESRTSSETKKFVIPVDPYGKPVEEKSKCFLPYLTRCCCVGPYQWGDDTLHGVSVYQIQMCSLGT